MAAWPVDGATRGGRPPESPRGAAPGRWPPESPRSAIVTANGPGSCGARARTRARCPPARTRTGSECAGSRACCRCRNGGPGTARRGRRRRPLRPRGWRRPGAAARRSPGSPLRAPRGALAHVMHVRDLARGADQGQPFLVALGLERLLEFLVAVEIILDRALGAAGDHQHVAEASRRCLLHDVLDRGRVDDRQYFLGRRLGHRQEPGAQARGRDDRLGYDILGSVLWFGHAENPSRTAEEVLDCMDRDEVALRSRKMAVRGRLLTNRSQMTEPERSVAGRSIRDAVLALPEAQMAGTVAAYASIGTEPETRGLIYALWKRGTYVLLPLLLADDDLDWASYEGPDSLAAGPRGLLQPTEPPPA